jgi:predicted MPP superfamily phosphohydrolase
MEGRESMKKPYSFLFPLLWVLVTTAISLCCLSARQCATQLSVVNYTVSSEKLTDPVRIVQLSDLHGKELKDLAQTVAQQQPDLIVMTGDMMDKNDDAPDVVCDLIRTLQDVAPIYYCYGNHEQNWMSASGTDLTPLLTEAGAVVLDTDFTDLTIQEQTLRIGGFHGYYSYWHMLESTGQEEVFAENFESTEDFKLLLNHIPTGWLDWGRMNDLPVDLVLTGHYHGGQIRIPLLGGLYAPYVGYFPKYTEGMYEGETATVILSAGLGSSPGIPRINNLPQLIVIDIV